MSRFRFVVYPEAERKLQKSGIVSRIEKAFKKEDRPNVHRGMMMASDVANQSKWMAEEGFFKKMTDSQRKAFVGQLKMLFENIENHKWRVIKKDGEHKDDTEYEDIMLLMGFYSSMVLPKGELWNYRKHGFSSLFAFTGAVGARVWTYDEERASYRDGYRWTTTNPDGTTRVNEITGDTNCDLRIFQKDITPYETYDPLGNRVEYRPRLRSDNSVISGYHSTEGRLLVSILKYVKQLNIRSEILKDRNGVLEFLNWVRSLGQNDAPATYGGSSNEWPMLYLTNMDYPIPVLDPASSTADFSHDRIVVFCNEGSYGAYIGPNGDLVLAYEKDHSKQKKEVAASFHPEEADHLIRGLFFQSVRGLGRTPVALLVNILDFYTSGEYEKENARMKAEFERNYPQHGEKAKKPESSSEGEQQQ